MGPPLVVATICQRTMNLPPLTIGSNHDSTGKIETPKPPSLAEEIRILRQHGTFVGRFRKKHRKASWCDSLLHRCERQCKLPSDRVNVGRTALPFGDGGVPTVMITATKPLRTRSAKNDLSCARQNLQVQPQSPIFHIGKIERHISIKRGVLPCPNLPQAGEPRQHLQTAEML
jgi:hypothetical protein